MTSPPVLSGPGPRRRGSGLSPRRLLLYRMLKRTSRGETSGGYNGTNDGRHAPRDARRRASEEGRCFTEELRRLEIVEKYHAAQISDAPPSLFDLVNETVPFRADASETIDTKERRARFRLKTGVTKHDAAHIALECIGRPAKIKEIAEFLLKRDYGVDAKPNILFNALFTALNRKTDMFKLCRVEECGR